MKPNPSQSTTLKNLLPVEKRTRCLVYTRVMGYHRPTESFNTGKKGEHIERKHFMEGNEQTHL